MARDTDRSAAVGHARGELGNVTGLVTTSETKFIVLAVYSDVFVVALGQLLNCSFDGLHSTRLAHRLRGVVGVAPGTIPVTRKGLRVEGYLYSPLLGNADKQVTSHPKVVAHINTLARANLELPLRRHDLSVDTGDVDTSVKT